MGPRLLGTGLTRLKRGLTTGFGELGESLASLNGILSVGLPRLSTGLTLLKRGMSLNRLSAGHSRECRDVSLKLGASLWNNMPLELLCVFGHRHWVLCMGQHAA